jgi:hypothetical protein
LFGRRFNSNETATCNSTKKAPQMTRHVSTLLSVYHLGDHLDDDELAALADAMTKIADACFPFGDLFRLQAVYAEKVRYDCNQFLKARREKTAA